MQTGFPGADRKPLSGVTDSPIREENAQNRSVGRSDGMDLSRFHSLDMVLVCGLPGSGKSHLAGMYFRESGRKRINRKEIRKLLYEMTSFGEPWNENLFGRVDEHLVHHVERKTCEHLLQNRQKLLIDNTSVTTASRAGYISLAHQMHRSIGVIYLATPPGLCMERNRDREDPVPESVISNLAAEAVPPSRAEGFEEVLILKPE